MTLFHARNRRQSADTERIHAAFEMAHTVVDLIAAVCFLIGSVLFFWESTQTTATWLFVLGSACFCLKPTLRFVREMKLLSMGRTADVAARL